MYPSIGTLIKEAPQFCDDDSTLLKWGPGSVQWDAWGVYFSPNIMEKMALTILVS